FGSLLVTSSDFAHVRTASGSDRIKIRLEGLLQGQVAWVIPSLPLWVLTRGLEGLNSPPPLPPDRLPHSPSPESAHAPSQSADDSQTQRVRPASGSDRIEMVLC